MKKIQRLSLILQIIFGLIFLCLPIYTVLFWFSNGLLLGARIPLPIFLYNGPPLPFLWTLPPDLKIYGCLINLIPVGLYMVVTGFLVRLFHLYAHQGEILSQRVVSLFKIIALFLLIAQIIRPLYAMLLSYVLTLANAPGYRFIYLGITLQDIIMISIVAVALLISWILEEYHALNEEQGYTV